MTYATYDQCRVKDVARERVSAFSPSCPFPSGTAHERTPDKDFRGQNLYAPLWSVSSQKKRYKLSKPIKVHIYSIGNIFFAENETLVVVGTGDSVTEAIDDFCRHIIHFYQYYKKLSLDKAIGDAVRLKKTYENLFVEQM